MGFATKFRS